MSLLIAVIVWLLLPIAIGKGKGAMQSLATQAALCKGELLRESA